MEELRKPFGLSDLEPGDHLCCIYQSEEEHRSLLTPYLRQGLERGEKVFYIVDLHTAEEVLGYLESDGIDTQPYLSSGQLSILTVDDAYMKEGEFDPDGMIALLRTETEQAVSEGYSALRVTGEMTWALKGLPGSERLIEYEAKLNHFFPGSRCMAICQYDRRHFSPDLLLGILTTHPIAVIGTEIYDNFYFMPPDEFLGDEVAAATLDKWCNNLASRRESEEALRISEEKYRAIVDSAQEGIWTIDGEGITTFVNTRMAEIIGYGVEEMLGHSFYDFMDEEGIKAAEKNLERRRSGIGEQHDFEFLRKGGSRIYTSLETSPLTDEAGRFIGALAMVADITKRRQMEEALRESEYKFRSVVEQSSDGIILVNSKGIIIEWNSAQESIMGLRREEALGRYLWDVQYSLVLPELQNPEAFEDFKSSISASLGEGHDTWMGETSEREIQAPDGRRRTIQTATFPVRSREGMMMGSITRDITRRVRMEEMLAYELEVNTAVAELSATLLAHVSIDDVSYVVLENAKRLTGSPFGYVGYVEADTGYLVSPTLSRDIWEKCEIADKSVVFKEFKGLWGWVLENRKPLLTNLPREDPRSTGVPDGHIPIERFISVPALLGGALVGQLALANSGRDYTEKDLDLMNRLADLYAMAVLRMWSEEELDRYREHLEELVKERTLELEKANRRLQEEIAERRRDQEELRTAAEQLRALTAYMESVREEERRSVALEVHDTLGQALTGLKISLSLLGKRVAGDGGLEERIEAMSELVDTTIQSVREISTQLRPGVLDDLGLAAALDWQVKRFGELTGLDCTFASEADDVFMDKDLAIALFRIAQEALTNIARHAGASRVDVRLTCGRGRVELEVKDDGRGISREEIDDRGALGILGMRERAHIFGGEVDIRGKGGEGTTLVVKIPVRLDDGGDGDGGSEEGGG